MQRPRDLRVLAANAPWPTQVTHGAVCVSAQGPSAADTEDSGRPTVRSCSVAYLWAVLLARIYEPFPLLGPHGGADLRIVGFVTEARCVVSLLETIGGPAQLPRISLARGPPQWEESFDQSHALDPPERQPAPAFEFDQTMTWWYPAAAPASTSYPAPPHSRSQGALRRPRAPKPAVATSPLTHALTAQRIKD